MRTAAACLWLALWLLVRREAAAQNIPPSLANRSNSSLVNFTVFGVEKNMSAGQIAGQLNIDGWDLVVTDSKVLDNAVIAPASAGNKTLVNCTLTPNATDCQGGGDDGLAWWVIVLIVLFSVAGAAGLGVLIWYLYTTYRPRTAGYAPVFGSSPPPDHKVISVALVSLVLPVPRGA